MSRSRRNVAFFLVWISSAVTTLAAATRPQAQEISLCEALYSIRPGESRLIRVTGIYLDGPEMTSLLAPGCKRNVQPITDLEFEPHCLNAEHLRLIVKVRGPALVTAVGTLIGPRKDPGDRFPPEVRAHLVRGGYGHMNACRTRFRASAVEQITAPLSAEQQTALQESRWWSPPGADVAPIVEAGEVPTYPRVARIIGLSGEVRLRLAIEDGVVAKVRVVSGDRVLAASATGVAKSWKFDSTVSRTCDVVFAYHLEERDLWADQNPRIEMQMPSRVVITAPYFRW